MKKRAPARASVSINPTRKGVERFPELPWHTRRHAPEVEAPRPRGTTCHPHRDVPSREAKRTSSRSKTPPSGTGTRRRDARNSLRSKNRTSIPIPLPLETNHGSCCRIVSMIPCISGRRTGGDLREQTPPDAPAARLPRFKRKQVPPDALRSNRKQVEISPKKEKAPSCFERENAP